MASADRPRNSQVRLLTLPSGCQAPVPATIAASTARMMTVRIRVAKSELIFSTPSLPKMAVRAAKTADSAAQTGQVSKVDFIRIFLALRRLGMRTLAKFMLTATEST